MTLSFLKKQLPVVAFHPSFILVILMYLYVGCAPYTKDKYIEDFRAFVSETKDNYVNYSEKDWAKSEDQFNQLSIDQFNQFKLDLSDDDKAIIGKLKGVYLGLKVKKGAKDVLDQAKDIFNQAKGMIEEVLDSTKTKSK